MKIEVIQASTRGHINHGWLNTYHTFSFAEYFDRNRMHFGALRVLNDDYIAPQSMFPTHPHNNMEIITVVLNGTIEHQDSMGNKTQISAGEIQVMSTGSGIYHSEANPSPTQELNLFQIWIFPKLQNIKPQYAQQNFNQKLQTLNTWHTMVAPTKIDQELVINQDAYISLANFEAATENYQYKLKADNNGVFIMLIDGSIQIENQILNSRDAIMISETNLIQFKALAVATRLIAIEVPMNFQR